MLKRTQTHILKNNNFINWYWFLRPWRAKKLESKILRYCDTVCDDDTRTFCAGTKFKPKNIKQNTIRKHFFLILFLGYFITDSYIYLLVVHTQNSLFLLDVYATIFFCYAITIKKTKYTILILIHFNRILLLSHSST